MREYTRLLCYAAAASCWHWVEHLVELPFQYFINPTFIYFVLFICSSGQTICNEHLVLSIFPEPDVFLDLKTFN